MKTEKINKLDIFLREESYKLNNLQIEINELKLKVEIFNNEIEEQLFYLVSNLDENECLVKNYVDLNNRYRDAKITYKIIDIKLGKELYKQGFTVYFKGGYNG